MKPPTWLANAKNEMPIVYSVDKFTKKSAILYLVCAVVGYQVSPVNFFVRSGEKKGWKWGRNHPPLASPSLDKYFWHNFSRIMWIIIMNYICRHHVAVGRVRTTASVCHCTKRITISAPAKKDLKVTTAKMVRNTDYLSLISIILSVGPS